MLEVAVILALLASGAMLLNAAGLRDWGLLPLGFLVGSSVLTVLATVQAAVFGPTAPLLSLILTVGGPLPWWLWSLRDGGPASFRAAPIAATAAASMPIVWLLREANLVRTTPDSFNLVAIAALLESGHLDSVPPETLEAWQVSMSALHAPASLQGEFYIRSMMPLFALATVGGLCWFIERSFRAQDGVPSGMAWWVAALGGVLLLSMQRFLYNAFYLNRHMMVASAMLLAGAALWELSRRGARGQPALLAIAGTSLLALAVGRGETAVVAGLLLLPLLTMSVLERRYRALLVAGLGAVIVVWNVSLAMRFSAQGIPVSGTALTFVALGAVTVLSALPIARGWRWFDPLPRWVVFCAEGGLWIVLLVLVAGNPAILRDSVSSTYRNIALGEGGWGVSLLVLSGLVLAVFLVTREGDRVILRLPMTAFVPFAAALAYIRAPEGLPYRVGHGDSLNRMLLHLVPLAIFYLASAPTTSLRWWHHPTDETEIVR